MRLLLLLLFLTFGIFESLHGQVEIGVSSGLNISNCKISELISHGMPRKGYFAGISPSYQINKKFQIAIDLQYSQKGYISEVTNFTNTEHRYSYFEMIPEIEYKPVKHLIFGLGVSYAYRINEESKRGNEDWISTRNIELIKSFDYGITGKIKGVYKNVFGFVRYNIGLKDISDLTFGSPAGDVIAFEVYNRNLQIGVGYIFGWGEE